MAGKLSRTCFPRAALAMRRRSGLSASPRAFLTALLVCKWVEAASADLGSYVSAVQEPDPLLCMADCASGKV